MKKSTNKRSMRVRRSVGILSAVVLALAGSLIPAGPATAADGPFSIDGTVPDDVAFNELSDASGSVKELGPKNGNETKIGVIHNAAPPMLALTNPNGQVDLRRAWLETAEDPDTGDDWLYFAWERDANSGSGFIAYEFMKADAPAACDYEGTDSALIANCNPWANRQAGDFVILWDQQGGSLDLFLRVWSGTGSNLTLGAPMALNATVSQAAFSPDGFRGEAAVNLTATIFAGSTDCLSFANTIPSTVTGNSDTADYKDTILEQAPPISNCGSVVIRKVTDPSPDTTNTSFAYTTTGGLDPSTFDLKDGESQDYGATVQEGSYSVTETDPGPTFALTDLDCSASDTGNGSTITPDLATGTVDFDLEAGDTVDCTYTNSLQVGALKILKQSTKSGNPLVANDGAVFSYDDGVADPVPTVTDNGAGDESSTVGEVCVSGLAPGSYTVNETTPPDGYGGASQTDVAFTVVAGTNCTDNEPADAVSATFTNAPLSDIQVNFRDGGSGETSAVITCDAAGDVDTTPATGWDTSETQTDIEGATTINCTIVIDP